MFLSFKNYLYHNKTPAHPSVSFRVVRKTCAYLFSWTITLNIDYSRMRLEALAGFNLDPKYPDGCGDVSSGFAFRVAGPSMNAACRHKPSITALVLGKNQGGFLTLNLNGKLRLPIRHQFSFVGLSVDFLTSRLFRQVRLVV